MPPFSQTLTYVKRGMEVTFCNVINGVIQKIGPITYAFQNQTIVSKEKLCLNVVRTVLCQTAHNRQSEIIVILKIYVYILALCQLDVNF